ncbi:zinc finger ZZ-type and EF-hand domain-containing protein 1-like, partial [Elysia marginata]
MTWKHPSSPVTKKFKVQRSAAKVMATMFWDAKGVILLDILPQVNNDLTGEVSEGILQAFNVAESVRLPLASERQRWNAQEDQKKESEADPTELFSSKALYLMRFAGLTKVQLRQEMRSKFYKQMIMKKSGNKQPVLWSEGMEKFPSFRLVMEFVQDPVWTAERVHQMLQERSKFASAISEVYMFSAEMLRVMSDNDPFQIPVVLYFREMSAYQHQFARHYADGLDGCGLSQEARVRSGYYTLIRRFVDAFRQNEGVPKHSKKAPAYDILQCILLHLLDVEWQPYDLSFIHEMQLPQLFMNFAKETVKMRDICTAEVKEEEELEEYNLYMNWFKEVAGDFDSWMSRMNDSNCDKKAFKWFIARFSDVLDVEITCDGCRTTLPGRRYRCLQCVDMDLCTACFIGGVEPEEHQDTHEIVHLVYKCNTCQGFIVSSRIHCNECDDFDLCLGCHVKQKFPPGHTDKHDVTKIPMTKLVPVKTNPSCSSALQAYIHQHAWLLYASLTLTLSDAVYSQETGFTFMDPDYFKVACQLQQQCLDQAIYCLDQVSCEIEGEGEEVPLEKRRERTFAMHSQERIMGLLGAVMPSKSKKEHTSECGYNFCTEDFLNRLLKVSRGDQGHELNTHHLALQLMGRLLAHSDTRMADISTQSMGSAEAKAATSASVTGQQTVAHLFSFGAKAFERSGLEWACSVARMLEMLLGAHQWQQAIQQHVSQCIQGLKHNVQPSSIFPMFVIAGFPEVLTTGALVDYTYTSLESQSGVVLKHFPDKCQTLVIDLKTRKRHIVKDQQVSCRADVADVLESESIDKFVLFAIDIMSRIQNGEELSVETLWVLSLVLKVLNRCFQSETLMAAVGKNVFSKNFVQCLVSLCCKGTGLNQSWLLKDLE